MNKFLPARKDIVVLQQRIARENCSRSFEQVFHIFYPFLHRFAFRIIKSKFIAEEIVSDVFVQVWKNRNRLEEVVNLRVFLYVSVRNTAFNYLYKSKRENICWMEEMSASILENRWVEDPYQQMDARELARQIQVAVAQLPPRCQVIYRLVREDGLKYTEVARVLNLSVKTIENQMGTALKKLATSLQRHS